MGSVQHCAYYLIEKRDFLLFSLSKESLKGHRCWWKTFLYVVMKFFFKVSYQTISENYLITL